MSEHDFQSWIQSFSLSVSLRMISSTQFHLEFKYGNKVVQNFKVNLGSRSRTMLLGSP